MSVTVEQLSARLVEVLLGARNTDGGWAYHRNKRSRVEPTCWALLALGRRGRGVDTSVLRSWPRQRHWLVDAAGTPINYSSNAIAALTMLQQPDTASADQILLQLVASKGRAFEQHPDFRQDNSLQAWPWVDETFSWVEPTAWCLLALKQRRARGRLAGADERIQVGEQMIVDRECRPGGWNFGNSNAFGQDLRPYVPNTALALLAMQDRRGEPSVVRGLQWLEQQAAKEQSLVALSLSVICLRAYGRPSAAHEEALTGVIGRRLPLDGISDDVLGLAMTAYALGEGPMAPFVISGS